jgi:hypothetical protein
MPILDRRSWMDFCREMGWLSWEVTRGEWGKRVRPL